MVLYHITVSYRMQTTVYNYKAMFIDNSSRNDRLYLKITYINNNL